MIIGIASLLHCNGQSTQNPDINWYTNLEVAKIASDSTGYPILLLFAGTDWCRPCIQLNNQVFKTKEFEQWSAQNVIPVLFEFPKSKKNKLNEEQQKYNDSMAEIYNPYGMFPKVVIVDKTGTEMGCLGYMDISAVEYIKKIEQIIKHHKPKKL